MNEAYIINLPKITDPRGNLTFIEGLQHLPFKIERSFWIYDVPGGETRGGHAYKNTDEFIIALSGSFDVVVDNGNKKETLSLNRSYYGLFIKAGTWRHMENFSTNAVAFVLSSTHYNESDYIRNYEELLKPQSNTLPNPNLKIIEFKKIFKEVNVWDCSIIDLVKIKNRSGNITPVESSYHIPFNINRTFYLYDIPGGESRGAHAHKECHQFLVATSGAFEVALDDGVNKRTVVLNRPYHGLHIPPGIWASEQGFSSGSICLVLASDKYNEKDYIRCYDEYIQIKELLLNGLI